MLLYSKKAKTPPVFKVLTSYFRDRLRFGFVPSEAAPDVKELPSIYVKQTLDSANNQIVDLTSIKYDKKDFKLEELKEFLAAFARDTKKAPVASEKPKFDEEQETSSAKGRKKAYA